jgi:predicted enzyme related to lactoylglutathione lyase
MERVQGIGGVFIRCQGDQKALLDWYREHLGIESAEWGGFVFKDATATASGLTWSIFKADTDYFGSRSNAFMVNYKVADLDAMLAQLRAAGVPVEDEVQEMEFGRFGWATDPEGNRIELWQPAETLPE